jgi:hypothetical protein
MLDFCLTFGVHFMMIRLSFLFLGIYINYKNEIWTLLGHFYDRKTTYAKKYQVAKNLV